jgi:2-methylcitrate dehydratase PrpD
MFMLMEKHAFESGDIDEIHVDCTRRTALFKQAQPATELEARGSLPFCLALAAGRRDPGLLLGPGFRSESIRDPVLQALAARVRITANEDYERQYPARSLARISVRLRDGTRHGIEVDRSEIARYLHPADADIEAKFRSIAVPVLGEAKAAEVVALVRRLEGTENVEALIEALQP